MGQDAAIAIVGTFDSKAEEHLFISDCIRQRGFKTLTVHVGAKDPSPFPADVDVYREVLQGLPENSTGRDEAIQRVLTRARQIIREAYEKGEISGIISAGGGTGTHIGTSIMRVLPLGVPKVMVSTVASRDMANTVGTKDITMIHSVADLLGVNTISGKILERAAAAVCGMAVCRWEPQDQKQRIALTFFGFITEGAEYTKSALEEMGYEVVGFHANGTGGMAMEELAAEGFFHGILDFGTHELADELMGGYCRGIGPARLTPVHGVPRLVVPGGLDCAVLEFTRETVPDEFRDRKIFYYDFRSGIRLSQDETALLADQLVKKLNEDPLHVSVLIPNRGWSEADRADGPLFDPGISAVFVSALRKGLDPGIIVREEDLHINDASFGRLAANILHDMVQKVD